jgi:hypothetical protein
MSLGIKWYQMKDGQVAVKALEAGRAALKCGQIETGDVLLWVEDKASAATVAKVEQMLQEVLVRKPSILLKFRRQRGSAGTFFGENVVSRHITLDITLDEWLVDGSSVCKGADVALAKEYSTQVEAAGNQHQHHKIYMLNATGVVTAIGLDKQEKTRFYLCIVHLLAARKLASV